MSNPLPRPFPGGPLALDLLNTRWRSEGQELDWLHDGAAVATFSGSHGVEVARAKIGPTRSALIQARDLIQRLVQAGTNGAIGYALIAEVNAVLASATLSMTMSPNGPRLSVTSLDPTRSVAVQAISNAIELIRDQPDRIRSCADDECVLWFLDTSKAGRRRWCSMERCGNRSKARRHYDRVRDP